MLKLFVSLQSRLIDLRDNQDGQAFAEYGVLIAIVAIGLIAGLVVFRGDLATAFSNLGNTVKSNT